MVMREVERKVRRGRMHPFSPSPSPAPRRAGSPRG
jgi:hypothetical protein